MKSFNKKRSHYSRIKHVEKTTLGIANPNIKKGGVKKNILKLKPPRFLKRIDIDKLCELFNADEEVQKKVGIKRWDIINEFIARKISVVNIQRAAGSMCGRRMRIWYNETRNCIEVKGYAIFEGTDLLQW